MVSRTPFYITILLCAFQSGSLGNLTTDGQLNTCDPEYSFTCLDGTCITQNLTCNSNADCKNGEDESVALCGCLPNEFACAKNDTCIALVRRCDRTADCLDHEDEDNCDTYMCPEGHVKCADHFCIPKELVCDFRKDCSDGSDEVGCSYRECWPSEFTCQNGECIPPGVVCDGVQDCLDASDETLCTQETCADGRLIHESYLCNGWPDCETTHLDELLDCPACNDSQHTCSNGRCITKSHTCDGVCDCLGTCDDEALSCENFYIHRNGLTVCLVGATISCSSTVRGHSEERCIAAEYICDGVNDCHTGRHVNSDEYGCDGSLPTEEGFEVFRCRPPDTRLLPTSLLCDFKEDCLQGDDELDCPPKNITIDGKFVCKNGQPIEASKQCDLRVDCQDKSDETDCENFQCPSKRPILQPEGSYEEEPMKRCQTGQCIPASLWCDHIQDCADGSDEVDSSCPKTHECKINEFRCRSLDQCIPLYLRCYDNGDSRSGCADLSHLKGCENVTCSPGTFKCRNGHCIDEKLRCNSHIDCVDVWNDEANCTYQCHGKCLCRDRMLNCTGLGLQVFPQDIQDPFNIIYFANNLLGDSITSETFLLTTGVIELDLSNNTIAHLLPGVLRTMSELRILSLRDNMLSEIRNGTFDGLPLLINLQLAGNQIVSIEAHGFYGLSSLTTLSLRQQKISNISRGAFIGLSNLNKLDLSLNKLEHVADGIFIGLSRIKDMSGNQLISVHPNAFRSVLTLENLVFDEFGFCCSARRVSQCLPYPDEFSSCEDLMSNFVLRICVWLLGISATFGNLLVIVWRIRYKHSNKVHSFLITNLAIGDLFMGVYLMVIAVVDARYRGEYSLHDKLWRTSRLCSLAGFLSTFSSELSVFTLTVITLDRFLAIIFPFRFTRLEMCQTIWVMLAVWVLAVFLSGLPLIDIEYFKDFYGRSGVCLALHITPDKPNGWEYSVFVFLVLNLVSFSIIAFGYVTMYGAAKTTSLAVGRQIESRRAEAAMARRMTLIVATDAACWVPIILLGILSLSGITVPKQVFAWVAVFVLPLNAAVNPVLYTISTTAFLDPATRNLRHLNRSFKFSRTENRSHRTYSTSLGASRSFFRFRTSFHKFHINIGSSVNCHNNSSWAPGANDFELNRMGPRNTADKGVGDQIQHGVFQLYHHQGNLSQVDEDDSDYESECLNEKIEGKFQEPVLLFDRRMSHPRRNYISRSSDSESAEEQHCCNHGLPNSRRRWISFSEGVEPNDEKARSLWPAGRKKKRKKRLSELYD